MSSPASVQISDAIAFYGTVSGATGTFDGRGNPTVTRTAAGTYQISCPPGAFIFSQATAPATGTYIVTSVVNPTTLQIVTYSALGVATDASLFVLGLSFY